MADSKNPANSPGEDEPGAQEPVVHDRRRVDPETGEVRHPDPTGETASADVPDAAAGPADAETGDADDFTEEDLAFLTDLAAESNAADTAVPDLAPDLAPSLAAERLADLQRLQAEYANYRKRVERDRQLVREQAVAEVVKSLLPVLDDLDRARAHGDLEGTPLELVAQKLRGSFERIGLAPVGAKGDVFDHNLHEAVYQQPTADVTVNTVADVIESGYMLGERLLRPAKVAVNVPAE